MCSLLLTPSLVPRLLAVDKFMHNAGKYTSHVSVPVQLIDPRCM